MELEATEATAGPHGEAAIALDASAGDIDEITADAAEGAGAEVTIDVGLKKAAFVNSAPAKEEFAWDVVLRKDPATCIWFSEFGRRGRGDVESGGRSEKANFGVIDADHPDIISETAIEIIAD